MSEAKVAIESIKEIRTDLFYHITREKYCIPKL